MIRGNFKMIKYRRKTYKYIETVENFQLILKIGERKKIGAFHLDFREMSSTYI